MRRMTTLFVFVVLAALTTMSEGNGRLTRKSACKVLCGGLVPFVRSAITQNKGTGLHSPEMTKKNACKTLCLDYSTWTPDRSRFGKQRGFGRRRFTKKFVVRGGPRRPVKPPQLDIGFSKPGVLPGTLRSRGGYGDYDWART